MQDAPRSLCDAMIATGVRRGFIVWDRDTKKVVGSHPVLDYVVEFLSKDKIDYDEHEAIFLEAHESGALLGAFLWRTQRGQGCGGIRMREYDTLESYIRDGIRLAVGMGLKSALAGLWAGGGKGVIASPSAALFHPESNRDARTGLLTRYGDFLTSLRGCYVAAEDAGITVDDVDIVYKSSRFTTCISPSLGGSGNPSVPTALGIATAMEGAVDFLGMGTLEGKRVAIQGCGNVGFPLIGFLLERGVAAVTASDIDPTKVTAVQTKYGHDGRVQAYTVGSGPDVMSVECDIFSPNGYGGIITSENVAKLKCRIVCGAANNQLLDLSNDGGMHERGIIYVPDFVGNRMGIVNCAYEAYGRVGPLGAIDRDPLLTQQFGREHPNSVFNSVQSVLKRAVETNVTPNEAATAIAREMAHQLNPIVQHRSQYIIDSLRADGWAS